MMAAGVVGLLRIPAFYLNNYITGQRLTRQAAAMVGSGSRASGNTSGSGASNQVSGQFQFHGSGGSAKSNSNPQSGQQPAPVLVSTIPLAIPTQHTLMGLVVIPRLQLKAPVVQGTDDTVLNTAVGHLSDSAMPGQPGITVLAAHNATWFRHVDELKTGDTVSVSLETGTYVYAVTGHEIVHTGTTLPNTAQSELILESCYPLDALYLTPKRYLVYAKLVRIAGPTISGTSGTAVSQATTVPSTFLTRLQVRAKVPSNMQAEGLLLDENSLPLGTLQYDNQPSMSFTESSVPLQVTNTMVQLFEAYLHASVQKKSTDLQTLFGNLPVSSVKTNPLFGAPMSSVTFVDPLSLTLDMQSGDHLERVTADTMLRVQGSVFHLSLTADVSASPNTSHPEILWLTLKSLSVQPTA